MASFCMRHLQRAEIVVLRGLPAMMQNLPVLKQRAVPSSGYNWQGMKCLIGSALMAGAAITFAIFVNRGAEARKQEKEAAESQAALLRYEQIFKPGATRKDIENHLRADNTGFFERCCYEEQTTATLVKIADDAPPWFCNELPVYIVFEFVPEPPFDPLHSLGADVLKHVHLVSNGEGCL